MKRSRPTVAALFIVFVPSTIAQRQMPNSPSGASASPSETVVKGAPVSADIIQISDMVMPNGEHKRQESRSRQCRDSQGRTYLDLGFRAAAANSSGEGGMPPILITDPVAHTFLTIDPVRKAAEISDWPLHQRKFAAFPGPSQSESNGMPPPPPPHTPGQTRIVKVEDVGTQVIQGFTVRGTKTTYSRSPENEVVSPDNSYSITKWVSDELKILVLDELKQGSGGSQSKAVNIVRTEPDASLFQIPPGYKVFDRREKLNEEHEKNLAERNLQQEIKTWTDPSTGLMWMKQDKGIGVTWNIASQYCNDLRAGGFSNWRLPTIDELRSIFDPTQNIEGYHIKGGIHLSVCCTWSSSAINSSGALFFNFINGQRVSAMVTFNDYRVLCVRSPGMTR